MIMLIRRYLRHWPHLLLLLQLINHSTNPCHNLRYGRVSLKGKNSAITMRARWEKQIATLCSPHSTFVLKWKHAMLQLTWIVAPFFNFGALCIGSSSSTSMNQSVMLWCSPIMVILYSKKLLPSRTSSGWRIFLDRIQTNHYRLCIDSLYLYYIHM